MIWRVQTAWAGGLHTGFIGREQHLAERDVARFLGGWILKNLDQLSRTFTARRTHPNFVIQATLASGAIARALDAGRVWEAYDFFHEFQDKFSGEFLLPVWMATGTVVVEAPPGLGPRTRKRFMTMEDFPPTGPRPEGIPAHELGALRRWKIAWSDRMGERHASVFVKEEEALRHLRSLLEELAERLHTYFVGDAIAQGDPEFVTFAEEAVMVSSEIRHLLHAGLVKEAYDRWRWFEKRWQGSVTPSIVQSMVGSVRLEVE